MRNRPRDRARFSGALFVLAIVAAAAAGSPAPTRAAVGQTLGVFTVACPPDIQSVAQLQAAGAEACGDSFALPGDITFPAGYTANVIDRTFENAARTSDSVTHYTSTAEPVGGFACDPSTMTCSGFWGYEWSGTPTGAVAAWQVSPPSGYRLGFAEAFANDGLLTEIPATFGSDGVLRYTAPSQPNGTLVYLYMFATPFTDIATSSFKPDIAWLYESGITAGCTATTFCPKASVTREQMAAFLDRAFDPLATATDYFSDDETSAFEAAINRLAAAGIVKGCSATLFCPKATVTRGQIAAFLDRALHPPTTATDFFSDDNGSAFEAAINRLAAAGIVKGCTQTTFCPTATATREQMAALLHRALGSA